MYCSSAYTIARRIGFDKEEAPLQIGISPTNIECSDEEWQARIDLAAAHRLAFMHGFSEGIFNHLTCVVPGHRDLYYQIPFGMHWSEVTASSFMEVGINDGEVKRGSGDVERSCYCIHAPIHKALPQAAAVFHTHMPFASALTRLEDPRIKEIGQTEVGLIDAIAYDDQYTGPAFDPREGERLAGTIGNKTVLFMANHGVTTLGVSVAEAYDRLYYLERAAQVQIYAMWTGQPLKQLPPAVIEKTKRDIGGANFYNGPTPAERHFNALKRILDKTEPDYKSCGLCKRSMPDRSSTPWDSYFPVTFPDSPSVDRNRTTGVLSETMQLRQT
jgi:ribulose-5-phosphate 4-epimerase/fuculose-1-phosphate aldolase